MRADAILLNPMRTLEIYQTTRDLVGEGKEPVIYVGGARELVQTVVSLNRTPGVRAIPGLSNYYVEMGRLHNNGNVLVIKRDSKEYETLWNTGFEGGRHATRVDQLADLERAYGLHADGIPIWIPKEKKVGPESPIVLFSDHAGYDLGKLIADYLNSKKYTVHDVGVSKDEIDASEDGRVDYPVYASHAIEALLRDPNAVAIGVCGTGIGAMLGLVKAGLAAMVYNKPEMIDDLSASLDGITIGGRVLEPDVAYDVVDRFLRYKMWPVATHF